MTLRVTDLSSNLKIVIVGTSGSGKTTFAQKLSKNLTIKHIDLDYLFWLPNWESSNDDEFKDKIDLETCTNSWVACGNHRHMRDYIWSKANIVIWLDYPLHVIFFRALKRTIRRAFFKEECCNGNFESITKSFFSKKSILVHVLKTYFRWKREYEKYAQDMSEVDFEFIRLSSISEQKCWMNNITKEKGLNYSFRPLVRSIQ